MAGHLWLQELELLLDAAQTSDGDKVDLRNLLFGFYRLLERGGQEVETAFEGLSEAQLSDGIAATAEALSAGMFAAAAPTDLATGVRTAANLLRALEHAITGLQGGATARRAETLAVSFGGHSGWLLPYPPRFRGGPSDWPPYFAKRALTKSRCISASLATGHKVKLRLLDAEFGDEIVGAACLFTNLTLIGQDGKTVDDNTAGPLVITALDSRDPQAIEAALKVSCQPDYAAEIIVFPELAVTPDESAEISRLLGSRPWDGDMNGHRPALVVAGSWHHQTPHGAHQNRAPVLNHQGRLIDHHVKIMVFGSKQDGRLLKEDIAAGDEILVLASPTLTVAVAICLDFCQTARANPYDELDVDLVLVTSLAGAKTTQAHAVQADRIWNRRKTGTFLVQQDEKAGLGVSGAHPSGQPFIEPATGPVTIRKIVRSP